jgi:hypothetical protein
VRSKFITHILRLSLLPIALLPTVTLAQNSSAQAQTSSLSRAEAPTPPIPGPFAVQSAEYKFAAKLDPDVLATASTEIWARAFWPSDLSKPHPIVFLLHGNHSTCRDGKDDFDCSYTNEGTCPAGQTVVPNHEGYNYLAQQLASLGYIAVTINANRGITCGNGNDADWGLNLARGRLVLRHIEQWNLWSTQGGAPASLGLPPDAFIGKVDLTNVGLMGHSRGGEGMRAAAALYRDAGSIWPARIPNLNIRGIFEIASVDGQAGRVLDADDMAWNQLLPMCDGDVNSLEGRNPFERMMKKSIETRKTPKSLTMVWGTNHNFYNTQWMTDESMNCLNHQEIHGPGPQSDKQQKIAETELSAFMLANVGEHRIAKMGELFDPTFLAPTSLTSITRIDRDQVFTFDRTYDVVVDDFDQATGVSSNQKSNSALGISIKNENSELPPRGEVTWSAPGPDHYLQLNLTDQGQGRDVAPFTSLDLRVGRPLDQIREPSTAFSVALVDSSGKLSLTVPITKFADIFGPGSAINLYQTVRIPMSEFGIVRGTLIQGVRIIFDQTAKGELYFANVRLATNDSVAFTSFQNQPLSPEDVIPTPAKSADPDAVFNTPPEPVVATPVPIVQPGKPSATSPTPIIPNFGFDPTAMSAGPKLKIMQAQLLRRDFISKSKYLSGRAGVEITVASEQGIFPAEARLPTLVMAGNKFSVSRYAPTGRLGVLIFSVPREEISRLPERGPMWIQYGRANAQKVWRLQNFVKSQLTD